MIYEQLLLAADFILDMRLNDARHLLQTIDHPKAKEWLLKLDAFQMEAMNGASATSSILSVESPRMSSTAASLPSQVSQSTSTGVFVSPTLFGTPPPTTAHRGRVRKPLNVLSLPLALIGGSIGASIGAGIWAIASYLTGFEFGIGAVVLGGLTGAGAVFLSGNRHGFVIQFAALVNALGGIFLGRYLSGYLLMLSDSTDLAQAVDAAPPFADKTMTALVEVLAANVTALDIIFVLLALYAAWRIAR